MAKLYNKSRTLYGIDRARPAIAKRRRAVVVEGYTDVIAAHGAGIEETVAIMATAITPDQLSILASHTDEVILALDADRAGREAMLRAQRVAGAGAFGCGWRRCRPARTRRTCSAKGRWIACAS